MNGPTSDFSVIHINTASSWRGGEQQVLYLAKALRDQKVDQIVVCKKDSQIESRCKEEKIPVYPLVILGELDFLSAYRIAQLARKKKHPILHAHTAKAHGLAILARTFYKEARLVVSRRVDFHARTHFLSAKKYKHPLVDVYIAISRNVKGILMEDGITSEKIEIAYSGIDIKRFENLPDPQPLYEQYGLQRDTIIFGNIGALVEHKDQATLIRATHLLKEELEKDWAGAIRFCVFITGEGKLRSRLERLGKSLALTEENLIFTGFQKEIHRYLSFFDVFVMSSREEGLGTSVLDAMAAGKPVVATKGGGIPEMVDPGKGGLLVDVGDATGLSQAMKRMVLSSDFRTGAGAYNRQRVKDFRYENTARDTIKIYKKVLTQ